MKVLIADDDGVTRSMLHDTLTALGHEVTACTDGEEAWKHFGSGQFALVVSDWLMPRCDGLELCRRIRAEGRKRYTYVILVTVREGKANFLEAMDAGVDDFVSKPFDDDQLAARLRVAQRILSLQEENLRISELVPVCAWCKSIRNDQQFWRQVEDYVTDVTGQPVTHGICPDCLARQQDEMARRRRR